jgi:hypothetical protein
MRLRRVLLTKGEGTVEINICQAKDRRVARRINNECSRQKTPKDPND